MTAPDTDRLDREIAANVRAQLDEKAQRRQRLRRVRAEFDRRRKYGKDRGNAEKLRRVGNV